MRIKRLVQFTAIFFILAIAGLFGYWSVQYYQASNTMTFVLKKYESTRDANKVRKFLLESHGEADNHNNCINLIAWGKNHQKDFIEIIEGINQPDKIKLGERLAFAATDSGQSNEFEVAFKDFNSEVLNIIRAEIQKNKAITSKK